MRHSSRAIWFLVVGSLAGACAGTGADARPDASRPPGSDGSVVPRHDGGIFVTDGSLPRPSIEEVFGPVQVAAERPPAIAGGTLTASATDSLAYASFPEEDRLEIVDSTAGALRGEVAFAHGAEPGRVVLDSSARAHVVLRRQGAVATVDVSDPSRPSILATRSICPEPRGLAFDAELDTLYVACASGELVALPTAPEAAPTRVAQLGPDLRDVVLDGDRLFVSRFHDGLVVEVSRATFETLRPTALPADTLRNATSHVVWRTISRPGGGVAAVYQSESEESVDVTNPTAYGTAMTGPLVQPMVALLDGVTQLQGTPLFGATLVVDVAVAPDASELALAVAGTTPGSGCQALVVSIIEGAGAPEGPRADAGRCVDLQEGRAVAVAYTSDGSVLIQTRAPDAVHRVTRQGMVRIDYGHGGHADTGLDMFHADVGAGIACASCHPEGGDDGHVWNFLMVGGRRTIPLRGGIAGTAPFHWNGEFSTMSVLLADVMGQRMGAGEIGPAYEEALVGFVDAIPQLTPPLGDTDAIARGRALFASAEVGCTSCHAGEHGSNEATVDVGTDGAFQVPSLAGLAYRAPYLHDGRARTLAERFALSGGGLDRHGHTTQLDTAQIDDLIAYLQSL
ncbi:MAG: c-type cytochrome [Sandaracinus sp.]